MLQINRTFAGSLAVLLLPALWLRQPPTHGRLAGCCICIQARPRARTRASAVQVSTKALDTGFEGGWAHLHRTVARSADDQSTSGDRSLCREPRLPTSKGRSAVCGHARDEGREDFHLLNLWRSGWDNHRDATPSAVSSTVVSPIKNVAVFCASADGADAVFRAVAEELGRKLPSARLAWCMAGAGWG